MWWMRIFSLYHSPTYLDTVITYQFCYLPKWILFFKGVSFECFGHNLYDNGNDLWVFPLFSLSPYFIWRKMSGWDCFPFRISYLFNHLQLANALLYIEHFWKFIAFFPFSPHLHLCKVFFSHVAFKSFLLTCLIHVSVQNGTKESITKLVSDLNSATLEPEVGESLPCQIS